MSSDRPHWYRRRIVIVIGAVVTVLVCAAAVFALTRPGDVFNPDVEFRAEPEETFVPTPVPGSSPRRRATRCPASSGRQYGYSRDRRRYLPTDTSVRPPFKRAGAGAATRCSSSRRSSSATGCSLTRNDGVVVAINRTTGKRVWAARHGLPGRLLARVRRQEDLRHDPRAHQGRAGRQGRRDLGARAARSRGRSRSRAARSPRRSSSTDRLYFGSENGTVYAMRANDGSVQWKFQAGGAAKGGLALNDGKLYFGTYGGHVYALAQHDRQAGLAGRHERRQVRPLAPATSTPPRRSPSGASTSATPTATCTRSRPPAASSPGGARPGLRVRLARGRPGPGQQADRLLRQLRRHVLRARRADRRHPLDVPRRRQDLRRRDGRRRPRLLLNWGIGTPARCGPRAARALVERARRVQPGRVRRPDAST